MMSHVPNLPNELSPWPRIRIGAVPSNATAVDRQTAIPRLRRGSSSTHSNVSPTSTGLRARASTDVARRPAVSQGRGRSTSFASSQHFKNVDVSLSEQRLDRKLSERKVQELLELRKKKLRKAKSKGDEIEVFRLKNLNLFDDIEQPENKKDEREKADFSGDFPKQRSHHGLTLQTDGLNFGFTSRPKSINQGHTAILCWHLKLELAQGLAVPNEFSQCTVHPTPSPSISSSSFTLPPLSPSSPSSGPRDSFNKRSTIISSTDPSTPCDAAEPSSPTSSTSTAIAPEPLSPAKQSSIASTCDVEDPFLYIAKYTMRRAKGTICRREAKRSHIQASSTNAKCSLNLNCGCTNHNCRTYLSGPPSKHCRFCKTPRLQPEIAAAKDRIAEIKTSALAQADTKSQAKKSFTANEYQRFEALQEDMKLVELYNAETEKRCRNGVWWEGWLVVEDLKRQGIVGSQLCLNAGESIVA